MSPTRTLARPLMSAIFISSGVTALKNPAPIADAARSAGLNEPDTLARVHAVSNVVGGLALATGRFPRLASLTLAAGLVPTTLVAHPFWSAPPEEKGTQQIHFLKNLGLLGGLLLATADTGGRESLPHRISRVSGRAARKAERKADRKALKAAGKKAGKRARGGRDALVGATHAAALTAGDLGSRAGDLVQRADLGTRAADLGDRIQRAELGKKVSDLGHSAGDLVQRAELRQHAADLGHRAGELGHYAGDLVQRAELRQHAAELGHKAADLSHKAGELGHQAAQRVAARS